jgi:hypothetical protein
MWRLFQGFRRLTRRKVTQAVWATFVGILMFFYWKHVSVGLLSGKRLSPELQI